MHVDEIPRDENGLPKGEYRLRHKSGSFNETIGPVQFVDGLTTEKLSGRNLMRIVAALGTDVDLVVDTPPASKADVEDAIASAPKVSVVADVTRTSDGTIETTTEDGTQVTTDDNGVTWTEKSAADSVPASRDELADEYKRITGKRAPDAWDADKLRARIEKARAA